MRRTAPFVLPAILVSSFALMLSACATKPSKEVAQTSPTDDSGLTFTFGNKGKKASEAGIGVNSFLWRATLDTLNFMPIASADPFGGTYVTDWHANAAAPNERFKIQVFILDTRLRADGIAVQVFRQVKNGETWEDAKASADTASQIENAILTRARQLRISSIDSQK